MIRNADCRWIELHRRNLAHPEDPDGMTISMSTSDYACEFLQISDKQAQHVA